MARRKSPTQPEPLKGKVSSGHPFFEIIEEAYQVFARPKPTSTEVCDCCMYPEIEADFFRPAIKELPLHYLQDWYFAAYAPEGVAKETWAYLLPRILETLATGGEANYTGLEVTLKRFDTGNPEHWSAKQWAVLDRFQRTYLKRKIEATNDDLNNVLHDNLDDVLCMFRLGGWPLEDLLDQVASMPDAELAQRLWQDWCSGGRPPGNESIWITTFWEGADNTAMFDFYTSPILYERMAALALAEDTEPELAARALAVASVIEANA
jgi:hypothetical protein